MSFTNAAGSQIEIGKAIALSDEDIVKLRKLTALMFASMGIPFSVIAEFFGVHRMTVRRWSGDIPEEYRFLLADVSLRTFFDSFLGAHKISFSAVSQKCRCDKETNSSMNFSDLVKHNTGSNIRYNSNEKSRVAWDTSAPRGGLGRVAAREAPQRIPEGISKVVAAKSPHRPRGGAIRFRLIGPECESRNVDIEGLRRFAIVRLHYGGLSWRQIGQFVGLDHGTCIRRFGRMPEAAIVFFWKADLESVLHTSNRVQRCLTQRDHPAPTWEKTAARTRGRKSGAKPGSRRL